MAQQAGNGEVPGDRRVRGENRAVSFGLVLVTRRLKALHSPVRKIGR